MARKVHVMISISQDTVDSIEKIINASNSTRSEFFSEAAAIYMDMLDYISKGYKVGYTDPETGKTEHIKYFPVHAPIK